MSDLYGCGDHGCIYGHPGGMGTNGGCACWRDLTRAAGEDGRKAVRQIQALRAERNKLKAELQETRRWIEQHNSDCLSSCKSMSSRGRCNEWIARGRYCPDCPQGWMIVMESESGEVSDE